MIYVIQETMTTEAFQPEVFQSDLENPQSEDCKISNVINKITDSIKEKMDKFKDNINDIKRLTADPKDEKKFINFTDNIRQISQELKKQIESIKTDKEFQTLPKIIKESVYKKQIYDFQIVYQDFNEAKNKYQDSVKERNRRNLKMVDEALTEEQIEKIIDSGNVKKTIQRALVSERLENVVADIEERHEQILRLEHDVLEIFQMMKDLANMVDIQGETLNSIEKHVEKSHVLVEKARVDLEKAEKYQKCGRKMQCCIAITLIIIIVAILVPTLTVVLKTS